MSEIFLSSYIPMNLTVEEFRKLCISRLDAVLTHTWVVTGDDRKMIQAFRSYLPTAPATELQKIMDFLPSN